MNPQDAALKFAQLGWSSDRARAFAPSAAAGLVPGRVVTNAAGNIAVTEAGPSQIVVQRRFAREAESRTDLPAVGDWLALEPIPGTPTQMALREVLPRTSSFVRNRPADGKPQVLAANVDTAFLVSGLDGDFNVRRIERYLILALDGGVTPVVVLNKADLATDLDQAVSAVHRVVAGTRVIVSRALDGVGIEEIRAYIEPGTTACLLGSSGVGKSTLTNALLGEQRQEVKASREDDSRGRHTTTHRELFALPGGGLLIDTPGLRSVGVLEDSEALEASFAEIEALARSCRFADCGHGTEPGCAVQAALASGALAPERLESHQKLEAERRSVELRSDERARRKASKEQGRFYRRTAKQAKQFKRGAS